jgi:hypothetical protein
MSEIVSHTLTMKFGLLQGRRIICEHCRKPFTYIWAHYGSAKESGDPEYSSESGMAWVCQKKAREQAKTICREKEQGEAICPHCQCYQPWMTMQSCIGSLLFCGLLLTAFGAGAGVALKFLGVTDSMKISAIAGAAIGLVIGVFLAKLIALKKGPHRERDPRSMTDEELLAFLQERADADPCLTWGIAVGMVPEGGSENAFSMGILDETENPIVPHEFSTKATEAKGFKTGANYSLGA